MGIISIQSHVSYGHAGNSSAIFPMQVLGHQAWPIYTVLFSNHTGYPSWEGDVLSPELIQRIYRGIKNVTKPQAREALVTGYLGSGEVIDIVCEVIQDLKRENPKALYFCDPVMGDIGRGFYVAEDIPPQIYKLINLADHISPNVFELEYLSGLKIQDLSSAKEAMGKLFEKTNLKSIMLTSFHCGSETISTLVGSSSSSFYQVQTPLLKLKGRHSYVGTGDLIASLFTSHYLKGEKLERSLQLAVSSIFSVLERSIENSSQELSLIDSLDQILSPQHLFEVR